MWDPAARGRTRKGKMVTDVADLDRSTDQRQLHAAIAICEKIAVEVAYRVIRS